MKIAVIGGGWAGLSAALYLHRYGHDVAVFEAAQELGGRARTVHSPTLKTTIDNGQHILLGGYTATLDLLRELDLQIDTRLYQRPFSLQAADGSFSMQAAQLPAPWHLLVAILKTRGLSLSERLKLVGAHRKLKRKEWKTTPGITVAQWLTKNRQSDHVVRCFWQPLCLAALNTPVDRACAQLFANVLRDSLGGDNTASHVYIPSVDLSSLWPEYMPSQIAVYRGRLIKRLTHCESHIEIDGEQYDTVVLAANARSSLRLLKTLTPSDTGNRYLAMLAAFEYMPIATITLMLARPWNLPSAMLMLHDEPAKLQFGQWLFDRSVFMQEPDRRKNAALCVVISDARALQEHPRDDVVAAVITQIKAQTLRFPDMPEIVGHELICEKRATFASVPNLKRPTNQTPWSGIWVAGDWTNTRYPAVLEGAVRSGKHAATLITRSA